jgi:hypothetical protein
MTVHSDGSFRRVSSGDVQLWTSRGTLSRRHLQARRLDCETFAYHRAQFLLVPMPSFLVWARMFYENRNGFFSMWIISLLDDDPAPGG